MALLKPSSDLKALIRKVMLLNVVLALLVAITVVIAAIMLSSDIGRLQSKGVPTAAIVVGMVLFFVAAIGFEGARYNSRGASLMCFVLLLFAVIATTTFVVMAFTADFTKDTSARWGDSSTSIRANVQDDLECCGFADTQDRPVYPCAYKAESCKRPLTSSINTRMHTLGALMAATLLLEIVGLGMTAFLWFSQVGEAIRAEMSDRKHDERAVLVGAEEDGDTRF
eukprot:CAMPEP_0196781914 /NCGR_PEP_ID=MMETSP1104-20130614/10435_1 /TAXON_ID=33652 /ORGANISM="Cafeteria sp., Strain Caron Lab Isolate" /LENGTH=224 /DNA_ID=CAMNT_0042152145 /DNA_START=9 /DNA_END=683 /DNA_ORIENTATION=-